MKKKIAILQSNYIPWKGYFDLINQVDEFILFDDMQYTRRDWRNRNLVKTSNGLKWLSIPVQVKGHYYQKIKDTVISDKYWGRKHWKTVIHNYAGSDFFNTYREKFEELYLKCEDDLLSNINYCFIVLICQILGIKTTLSWSMDYRMLTDKTQRLVDLCKQAGANEYVSGPAARNYMDEDLFKQENIKLSYINYSGYPEYHQMFGAFEHGVSIIDLIFCEGPNAHKYMKSFNQNKS